MIYIQENSPFLSIQFDAFGSMYRIIENHQCKQNRDFHFLPQISICFPPHPHPGQPFLPSLVPGNHLSIFCSYSFDASKKSYKGNHTVCGLLCLASNA